MEPGIHLLRPRLELAGRPQRLAQVEGPSDAALVGSFEDGKSALYSSSLLHITFLQAEELKETDWNPIE